MKKAIYFFAGCLLVAVVALFGSSLWTAREASAFLSEMEQLNPNSVTNQDAERLARRFRSYVFSDRSQCQHDQCQYYFRFNNAALAFFRLAPPSRINGGIKITNGKLQLASVVFHQQPNPQFDVHLGEFPSSPELIPFRANLIERSGDANFINVYMTGAAQAGERRAAFALHTRCLARIGGCRSLEEIAPELWRIANRN